MSELRQYGYSIVTEDHIKSSSVYTELQEENRDLRSRYDLLRERYTVLVRMIREEFRSQFRLKDLLDKQEKEEKKETQV